MNEQNDAQYYINQDADAKAQYEAECDAQGRAEAECAAQEQEEEFKMIEPSDAERATLSDVVRDYIFALETELPKVQKEVDTFNRTAIRYMDLNIALEKEIAKLREALQEIAKQIGGNSCSCKIIAKSALDRKEE